MAIKTGDRLRIRPEWRDGDIMGETIYIAMEDEFRGRVEIEAQVNLHFKPRQTVDVEMVMPE